MKREIESAIRQIVSKDGGTLEVPTCIGNVHFWIDATGPWAGQLSYDLPLSQWNSEAIVYDVREMLP